jgi:glycogen synthase
MKATVFTWEYPPNVYGGAGVHAKYITAALSKLLPVEVRTVEEGAPPDVPGIPVRRYRPSLRGLGPPDPRLTKAMEVLSFNINAVSDPIDSDVVHTHTWYTNFAGALAKRIYGCKLVATVHSLEPLRPWKREQLGSGYELSSWMEKEGLEACDGIVAVSQEMKRDILKCYDIPSSRVSVIHNGVDPDKYRPRDGTPSLAKFGIRKPFVFFVGRLSRQKGVFDLLDAMEYVPKETTLVLATGKPDTPGIEEELKRAVAGMENLVWIPQMLEDPDLVGLYNEAAVFACPSIYEPFGIINLEAMACETPVVATRVGGIKEVVVDRETGLFVPPGDPLRLGRAIARVLEDPALAVRMGKKGRRRVLKYFTWDRIAERTVRLYRSLAE